MALLTLGDLDSFLKWSSEMFANPQKPEIEGVKQTTLLPRVQEFALRLAKGGLFNFDATFIYQEDPAEFLDKLVTTLQSIRPRLVEENKPIELRSREEIVEAYEEHKKTEVKHRGGHFTTREDIEKMTKNWLLSQKEAALIAEHLKTTSRLTDRTLSQVETAKNAIAKAIAQNPQIMEQLIPLLPKENRQEAITFLTEHLADGVSSQLSSVYYDSDISSAVKNGVVSTLKDSSQGRKVAAALSANATLLDDLTNTIAQNHAREVLDAARGTRMVQKVFEKTGGQERLDSFVEMSQSQLAEELQDELTRALNLSPTEKNRVKIAQNLINDFTRSINKELSAGKMPKNIKASFEKFLAEHPNLSQLASLNQADISNIARRLQVRSEESVRLLTSAKRLQHLSYPKQVSPQSALLFQRVHRAPLPSTLLSLPKSFGGFFRMPPAFASGSALNIISRFNHEVPEGLLFSLLGYDRSMLSQFKTLYTTLLSQGTVEEARRARNSLLLIRKAEEFMRIHPRRHSLFKNYWKMTNLGNLVGPLSSQNPRYRSFLQRIIIDVGGRRANSIGWQRFFGFARSYGSSFSSSSFSSLSQFLTNALHPRFFGSDIAFKNGAFRTGSFLFDKAKRFLSKGVFGTIGRFLGGLAARSGLSALLGSVFPGIGTAIGTIIGAVAPFILKHWKKVAAGALGAGYLLMQLLFGNLAQIASFIVTSLPMGIIGFAFGGPIGSIAAIGLNAFIHAQFGGWGGLLSAASGWLNGFLSGLSAAGSAVGGALGGIFAGGVLAATALLVPIAVLIGTLAIILTTASGLFESPKTTGGDIASCSFYRGGDANTTNPDGGLKFRIAEWPALINDVAAKVGIPPSIIASLLRVECNNCFYSDNPDYIKNDFDPHCSKTENNECHPSGIYGLMQFYGPTFEGVFNRNKEEMEKLFGKTAVSAIPVSSQVEMAPDNVLRIYSVKDSIIAAAYKIKQDVGTNPPYDRKAIERIVKPYFGNTCSYVKRDASKNVIGTFNYCDDVWKSYSSCQKTAPDAKSVVGWADKLSGFLELGTTENPGGISLGRVYNKMVADIKNGDYSATKRAAEIAGGAGPRGIYWCTNIVIDAFNLAGRKGLDIGKHQAVVNMVNFWKSTTDYLFLDYTNGSRKDILSQVQPGYAFFLQTSPGQYGPLDHVAIVKGITINTQGDGVLETYDSNYPKKTERYEIDGWNIKGLLFPYTIGFGG